MDIVWNLGIGIWDFRPITVEVNCFSLAGLLSTLMFPWVIVSSCLLDGGYMVDIIRKGFEFETLIFHI